MALGRANLDDMVEEMSSAQIAEWMAYDRLEPFGEARADLRNAILCQLVASLVASKDTPSPKIKDFLPDFDSQWEEKVVVEIQEEEESEIESPAVPGVMLSKSTKSSLVLYDGEAPAIRRIGKRASNVSKKTLKLREILKDIREEDNE